MSINKLALIRYKTIDACLQNRQRKWTLDNLIDKVSDVLYELEGIQDGVSRRTIQLDIQNMRSDKLGYDAPIIVVDKKYYTYEDPKFSIMKTRISQQDVEKLNDAIRLLDQFKGFSFFEDMSTIVGKLEDKIARQLNPEQIFIDFEKNDLFTGLHWIDVLLRAIKSKQTLAIHYQSFKAKQTTQLFFYPYLLKEYRNRWFLLGQTQDTEKVQLLALDRIKAVSPANEIPFMENNNFDAKHFFDDVIGVTKNLGQKTIEVVLEFDAEATPYVMTKPLHASQQILNQTADGGVILSINVVYNYELQREILGFGENVKVISPRMLQQQIVKRLTKATDNYTI